MSDSNRSLLPPLLLVATGMIVYANSLGGPFLLDDMPAIVHNPSIRQLWPPWTPLWAPADVPGAGRPVVNLTYAINYALGGLEVYGYHLLNVAVHILATLALYGLVRRTLLVPSLRERFGRESTGIAFACALIWLVHPLLSECVNYVGQRSESLMGLFMVLTLYFVVRASDDRSPRRDYVAAVLACALGMASKEAMVGAPVLVLLYDRAFLAGSFKKALIERRGLYLGLAATWALLAALILSGPDYQALAMGMSTPVEPWEYALVQSRVVAGYLKLAVWPHPLLFDYGAFESLPVTEVLPYAAGIGLLLALTLVAVVYRPRLGFLGASFFIVLAPTSSFVPLASEVAAERRMYVPLAALIVLAVLVGHAAAKRWIPGFDSSARKTTLRRAVGVSLTLAVALPLAWVTVRRNEDYRTPVSIWTSVVENHPHPRALNNLGAALAAEGRVDEAITQYRRAVDLDPEGEEAHNNLGVALQSRGNLAEAEHHFRRALEIEPDYSEAHGNLAMVLYGEGRVDEAMRHFRRAVELAPGSVTARNNLGIALIYQGRVDEAVGCFRRAVELDPRSADAHGNLGASLLAQGRPGEAAIHLREAIRLNPDDVKAQRDLQRALSMGADAGP